jgi:hypothetical protein
VLKKKTGAEFTFSKVIAPSGTRALGDWNGRNSIKASGEDRRDVVKLWLLVLVRIAYNFIFA